MKPARIVLSRKAGFDLQAVSQALNGLPAQSVARPGRWGNPFTIAAVMAETGLGKDEAQAEAVARHARWLAEELEADRPRPSRAEIRAALGGKNLACWCRGHHAMSKHCWRWPIIEAFSGALNMALNFHTREEF